MELETLKQIIFSLRKEFEEVLPQVLADERAPKWRAYGGRLVKQARTGPSLYASLKDVYMNSLQLLPDHKTYLDDSWGHWNADVGNQGEFLNSNRIKDAIKILDDILRFIKSEGTAQRKRSLKEPSESAQEKQEETRSAFREPKLETKRVLPVKAEDYEVVLSFAGEDRGYVEAVAQYLEQNHVRVFYDRNEEVSLWGKESTEFFDKVYRGSARYCVMFISKHYVDKVWTTFERRSALAKAVYEKEEYILPARFDDTELPGIRPTIGYVDLTKKTPQELGKMILQKLGKLTREGGASSKFTEEAKSGKKGEGKGWGLTIADLSRESTSELITESAATLQRLMEEGQAAEKHKNLIYGQVVKVLEASSDFEVQSGHLLSFPDLKNAPFTRELLCHIEAYGIVKIAEKAEKLCKSFNVDLEGAIAFTIDEFTKLVEGKGFSLQRYDTTVPHPQRFYSPDILAWNIYRNSSGFQPYSVEPLQGRGGWFKISNTVAETDDRDQIESFARLANDYSRGRKESFKVFYDRRRKAIEKLKEFFSTLEELRKKLDSGHPLQGHCRFCQGY